MLLGIDASRAVSGAPTGTEYYSRALIAALLEIPQSGPFRLYTRTAPPPHFFPQTNNYDVRTIPFPRLWTHVRLAYEMWTRSPDALFVPAHVLPLIHPRNAVVTVHDLGFKHFPEAHPFGQRMYLDWSTRWNARAARVVIADSHATRADLMKSYGTPADKIRVVYPGFNREVFHPSATEDVQRVRGKFDFGAPYVVAVGTVQPRKNYLRLIEAMAQLPEKYTLLIAGKKGWRAEDFGARVQALGMTARVRWLDYVPPEDLPALYGGAELAVFPSLYEGFGFPALEAQACGTPLVCSNASSLPEVAGDGALFFDPYDVNGMAMAMNCVLEDQSLRPQLVERGRANVARFSWERAATQMLEIVREG